MAEAYPEVEELVEEGKQIFDKKFPGAEGEFSCGVAPGRVNLLGGHVDYNGGCVLPMALPLVTVVLGKFRSVEQSQPPTFKLYTNSTHCDPPNSVEEQLADLKAGKPKWANYCRGVLANFHSPVTRSFDAVIVTSVPLGGGMSSSASLEVAFYTFLEAMTQSPASSLKAKALSCQKAEHDFAGMPCGIMDQFVSTMAREGSLLKIDCRSMEVETIPFNQNNESDPIVALVTNSNVRHELTDGAYSSRRDECQKAASLLRVPRLRDTTLGQLLAAKTEGLFADKQLFKTARHVLTEMTRTEKAIEALKTNNFAVFGQLISQSHISLRDDYGVSCPELDQLFDLTVGNEGVLGCRLFGGGFGGCTVALVKKSAVQRVIERVKDKYSGTATCYVFEHPSAGARTLKI